MALFTKEPGEEKIQGRGWATSMQAEQERESQTRKTLLGSFTLGFEGGLAFASCLLYVTVLKSCGTFHYTGGWTRLFVHERAGLIM